MSDELRRLCSQQNESAKPGSRTIVNRVKAKFSLLVFVLGIFYGTPRGDAQAQDLRSSLPQATVFWCQTTNGNALATELLASSAGQSVGRTTLNSRLHQVFEVVLSADASKAIHDALGNDFDAVESCISALTGSIEIGVWKTGEEFDFIAFVGVDSKQPLSRALIQSLKEAVEPDEESRIAKELNELSVVPLAQIQTTILGRRIWVASEEKGFFIGSSREVVERFQEPKPTGEDSRHLSDSRSFQTIAESTNSKDRRPSAVRFFVDSRWLLESGFGPFTRLNPNAPPSIGVDRDKTLQTMVKAGLFDTAGFGGVFEFADEGEESEWTLEALLVLTEPRKGLLARPIFRALDDIGGEIVPDDVDVFYTLHCDLNELQSMEDGFNERANATELTVQEMTSLLPRPTQMFCFVPASREFSTGRIQCFGRSFTGSIRGIKNITAFEAQDARGSELIESWMKQSRPEDWEQVIDSNGEYWVESSARYEAKLKRNRQIDPASTMEMPRHALGLIGNFACNVLSDVEFRHANELWRENTHGLRSSKEFSAAYRHFRVSSDEKAPIGFWYYARGQWLRMTYESARDNLDRYQQVQEANKGRRPSDIVSEANIDSADIRAQLGDTIIGDSKLPEFVSLQQHYGALIGGVVDHETGFKLFIIQMRPVANENQDRSPIDSK